MATKDEAIHKALKVLNCLNNDRVYETAWVKGAINACEEALEQPSVAELNDEYLHDTHVKGLSQPEQEPKCSNHPDAPHGFCRNASHSAGRYVCECEFWEQPAQPIELKPANIAKARDEIYYAWRKHLAWGIPSKDGEAVFNANGDGFLAGWLACEDWINKEKNT